MSSTLAIREPRALRSLLGRKPFRRLREEIEELMSDVSGEDGGVWPSGMMVPDLDLSETDNSLAVRMDLPGVKPEEIDIQLSNGVLTISGERKEEKEEKGKTFHRVERRCGSFSRSVALPAVVAEDKVDAQYRDGILTITLQKTEEAKSRKIKVKT